MLLDRGLLTAAENGDLNKVKDLVNQGANLAAKDKNGIITPIHYGYVDIVKYLLEDRVNLEAKDGNHSFTLRFLE